MKTLEIIAAIYVISWVLAVIICICLTVVSPPEYDEEENHEIN